MLGMTNLVENPFGTAPDKSRARFRRALTRFLCAQAGVDMELRNSMLDLVLVRRLRRSSMASTVESGPTYAAGAVMRISTITHRIYSGLTFTLSFLALRFLTSLK